MAQPSGERPPRVFLDANVIIAGCSFPRWSYEVLRHALKGDFQVVLCSLVMEQARRHLEKDFPVSAQLRFEKFLDDTGYEKVDNPAPEEIVKHEDLVRDLDDVPLALSAIKAKVDYFVTQDKDLTTKDASTDKLRQSVEPMLSGTFLKEVMGWSSEELENIRHREWLEVES